MREEALKFCEQYKLSEKLADMLVHLPKAYWWVFVTAATKTEKEITVKPGYYDRTGPTPKRRSVKNDIVLAASRAKLSCHTFNIAPRGGVWGQRVTISYDKAS